MRSRAWAAAFTLAAVTVLTAGRTGAAPPEWPELRTLDAGTVHAWIAYGSRPALGYGFAPAEVLAKLPAGEARDPDFDFRDFGEWASGRGITLVRSGPPSTIVGPRWEELFERAAGEGDRVDLARFRPQYFTRLREACAMFRSLGIFVQLTVWDVSAWENDWERCYYHPARHAPVPWAERAGPGGFVVDPESAPELVAHQREHLRRVLDATGDLGHVFYELASGIGGGFGESGAWVEAMLDEVAAWEDRTGVDVLVGVSDGGRDRAGAGFALGNPRLDVAFADPARADLHREIRERYGKPTVASRSAAFENEDDPSLRAARALLAPALRTLWRMYTVRCQMACLPADFGRCAYRGGALNDLEAADLPGSETPNLDATFARADVSPGRVLESPAPVAQALIPPRRKYYVVDPQVKQATVFLECAPEESGVDIPEGTLAIDGVAFLAAESPFRVSARSRRLETGEESLSTHGFTLDDLVMELPAFRDGLVVTIRPGEPREPGVVGGHTDDRPDPPRATVVGQSVTLDWEWNPKSPEWVESRATIFRFAAGAGLGATPAAGFPFAGELGCTPGLRFVDVGTPPGPWIYMLRWRDASGSVSGGWALPTAVDVEVPDVVPGAPQIVIVPARAGCLLLWAKGEPAADLARWEWERCGDDGGWERLAVTDAFVLPRAAETPSGEIRVRGVDAAGQAGPFSDPVRVGP